MSTVVAVQKGGRSAIAWDTMCSQGSSRQVNKIAPQKVIAAGASYLGTAGFTVYWNLLEHVLQDAPPPALHHTRGVFEFFLELRKTFLERYHLVNEQSDSDNPSPFSDLDSEFLVINAHGMFHIGGILTVSSHQKYCAIGSGAPHAEGALSILYDMETDASVIARRAVESALIFDAASGGEVEVRAVQPE